MVTSISQFWELSICATSAPSMNAAGKHGLSRIPRPNDHVFIPLKANKPPRASAHHEGRAETPDEDAKE